MNGLRRFVSLGLRDADERVARRLAAPSLEPVDRYLCESTVVSIVDRVTIRLQRSWMASRAGQAVNEAISTIRASDRHERYRSGAVVLLTAVVVHLILMFVQQPRVGWFWLVIPSMVAALALLMFAAVSREPR